MSARTVEVVDTVDISKLSDDELWRRTEELALRERESTADLIEHLAEIDDRRLSVRRGYGVLFDFCVNKLRMSEGAAFKRIRAARAIRTFPPILTLLRDGRLSLTAIAMLHPHLNEPDVASLVTKAAGLRMKKLEALLSERQSPGPARDVIRFVGATSPPPTNSPIENASLFEASPIESGAATIETAMAQSAKRTPVLPAPQAMGSSQPNRAVRLSFTADENFYRLLARARGLLRHKYPDGRLEGVLGDALKLLIERKDPVLRAQARQKRKDRGARAAAPSLFG